MPGRGRYAVALWLVLFALLLGRSAWAGSPSAADITMVRQVLMLEDDERFSERDYDDSRWSDVAIPAEWSAEGFGTIGWYRLHFSSVESEPPGAVYLGRVTGAVEVFLNGSLLASHGRIGQRYVSHFGPTAVIVLPPELMRPGDNVLAVRVLDTWIGGLAYDRVRVGFAHPLEVKQAGDLWLDRLLHSVLLAFWLLVGLSLVVLLALGWRSGVQWCAAAGVLANIQWTAYQSSLADIVGRSAGWELVDLAANFLAAAAAVLLPLAHTRLLKRSDLLIVGLWIGIMAPPLAIAPLWALRSGWWTVSWLLPTSWSAVSAVRLWRARSRIAFDVVLGITIATAISVGLLEVGGAMFEWPPLVKRFLGHLLILLWLSSLAALAIRQYRRERSRLREMPEELWQARRSERARVAHELHDGIGQELQVVSLQLQTLRHAAAEDQDLDQVTIRLKEALSQMRAVTYDLKNRRVETNLADRLVIQAATVRSVCTATLSVEACKRAADRLDAEANHQLFRIFQQALSNALEHASAEGVQVTLSGGDETVELSVRDDGCGFDARTVVAGVGLESMCHRAQLLGGHCEIESSGAGTVVTVRVPCGETRAGS